MSEYLLPLLPYFLPPLLGAVIGYVTNAVAIRMLFRPLRAYTVLGLRLPFTPGIIPRQRQDLARSIGSMVATRLLTEDIIRAQITSDEVREGVTRGVAMYTERALHGVPASEQGGGETRTARKLRPGVEHAVTTIIRGFLSSDELPTLIGDSITHVYGAVGSVTIGMLLPDTEQLGELLEGGLQKLPETELWERILETVSGALAHELRADRPLGSYLGNGGVEHLQQLIERSYDPLRDAVLKRLRAPDAKRELTIRGKVLLRDILDKLTSWQRLLVSAGQYDKALSERMPEIVDDLLMTLEQASNDEENRTLVIGTAKQYLAGLLDRGVADLCYELELNPMEWLVSIFDGVARSLGDEDQRRSLSRVLGAEIERLRAMTLREFVEGVCGFERDSLVRSMGERVAAVLRSDDLRTRIAGGAVSLIEQFLDRARSRPLYQILALSRSDKQLLDEAIARRAVALIEEQLPEIISVLDMESLVVRKINGLDPESVERLLLMVIAKHLKWINIFGAVLGSLIGASQVLMLHFFL